ncbi:MAG TPA: septal ring lytic transglycosylase RlpA family protein [Methylocella sp.]|nr:septal ring lytic transglycosylase RlpA family protein [Methylocella sp.]
MKSTAGTLARPRTMLAVVAATLLIGGTATGASAKSKNQHHSHTAHKTSGTSGTSLAHAHAGSGTGRSFSGIASFYGNNTDHETASGQRFDENRLTCAHRSLPFGTKLRVTHGARSVVVTVNDRGPYIRGRILDLSTAAARAVGLIDAGVGKITAQVIS